jgi:hypothetical protein
VECVKLCKCLQAKHDLTIKETAEGGKEKFKIALMHLKVETLSFKIKKKFFKCDHF